MHDRYVGQVRLLLRVLPEIAKLDVFALKGGTAINLFYRDMPRLSVDIDLTCLPVGDRETSLKEIDAMLRRVVSMVTARYPQVQAQRVTGSGGTDHRIVVSDSRAQIKVELSPVMRGSVHPPTRLMASDAVVDQFGFAEMNVLAFEDLYGGKLHAALDRQHPRDLFDVKLLYENEGLTDDLFRVFMVYVASSNRPMHEVLAPSAPFDDALYGQEFVGMTRRTVTKEQLVEARARLHSDIRHVSRSVRISSRPGSALVARPSGPEKGRLPTATAEQPQAGAGSGCYSVQKRELPCGMTLGGPDS